MRILVIIPAYNEADNLPGVIHDLREKAPACDIIVVDDGSHDATSETASAYGVPVLRLPFNLGIGAAMQTGYQYANQHQYDAAVQFDGDGQHIASDMRSLLDPLRDGGSDIVVGSRFLNLNGYQAPFFRRIGIRIFSSVLTSILGRAVTDPTSGFRAANRRVIEFFARSYPEDYPEVESLVLLHRAGLNIAEVPVRMRNRTSGRSSITPIRSVYYMIKVLLAVFIDLLKKVR